jgi:hypothetical protein
MSNQVRFGSLRGNQVGNRSNRSVGHAAPDAHRQKHRDAMMAAAAHFNHYMALSGRRDFNITNPFLTMNKVSCSY